MTRNVSKGNDMAKVFLSNEDRACHRFATWVQGEKKLQKVNDTDLAEERGISQPAMSRKLRLESFDLKDFACITRMLGADADTLMYILGL